MPPIMISNPRAIKIKPTFQPAAFCPVSASGTPAVSPGNGALPALTPPLGPPAGGVALGRALGLGEWLGEALGLGEGEGGAPEADGVGDAGGATLHPFCKIAIPSVVQLRPGKLKPKWVYGGMMSPHLTWFA
jgi:hypothetical protein